MNSLERIYNVIKHQPTDHIPVSPILSGVTRNFSGDTYEAWASNADICAEGFLRSVEEFDHDMIVTYIDLAIECDLWGQNLIFFDNKPVNPDRKNPIIKSIGDYAKIQKKDYNMSKRMSMHLDVCRRLVERVGGEKPIIAFVVSPLGIISMMRDQSGLFMDFYDDPSGIINAVNEITETLKDYYNALLDTGIDGIMVETVFASQKLMSRDMWINIESGTLKSLGDIVHQRERLFMLHNCNNKPYFDAMIDIVMPDAVSFMHAPADCKSLAECKEKYGNKTALMGCIPPHQGVIGTDEDWKGECMRQIDELGEGGGFILSTGCEYPANGSLDRIRMMVDTARQY
jgi:uroporphyrinogen decarboxylase